MTPASLDDQTVVFRSRPALMTAISLSVVLVGGALLLWSAMGALRDKFTGPQVGTLIFFVLFMVGLMMAIGMSTLVASRDGVTVRNVVSTTRFRWDEIAGVSFSGGDPWAYLNLRSDHGIEDGETHMILAMQRAEGDAVTEKIARLRELIAAHTA
ncbi:MAG TPA: PH domain-containing protein [Propionibacteriaceae bacterium]|nr:PH domain-containing protein [Propionibacteriaceae bacterium]